MEVHILLPASKTDTRALGCKRVWGCICKAKVSAYLCPYHAAVRQTDSLTETFPDRRDDELLPFFPTATGCTAEKEDVVRSLEAAYTLAERPTHDAEGLRLLGGHSLRIGGSRHLALKGLHTYQIELLARWASPMILHYARAAPLATITETYVQGGPRTWRQRRGPQRDPG